MLKTIKVNASCFIIPNRAVSVMDPDWINPEETIAITKEEFELNHMEFDPNCKLVEVWIHSEELHTDNLNCHGGCIDLDDDRVARIGVEIHYIPSTFFERRKEGSVIKYNAKGWMCPEGEKAEDVIFEMDLTLNQLGYRYRSQGPFEEALKKVTA